MSRRVPGRNSHDPVEELVDREEPLIDPHGSGKIVNRTGASLLTGLFASSIVQDIEFRPAGRLLSRRRYRYFQRRRWWWWVVPEPLIRSDRGLSIGDSMSTGSATGDGGDSTPDLSFSGCGSTFCSTVWRRLHLDRDSWLGRFVLDCLPGIQALIELAV